MTRLAAGMQHQQTRRESCLWAVTLSLSWAATSWQDEEVEGGLRYGALGPPLEGATRRGGKGDCSASAGERETDIPPWWFVTI